MADVALRWSASAGSADLAIEDDDVASDDGLRTAVLLSLFLDRRAEDDDALPSGDGDRRGWWGDELADVEVDRIGSRLWLLDRAKRTRDVALLAEQYARESLQWLLDDRVAESVEVSAEATSTGLEIVVAVHRPDRDAVSFRFAHAWTGETQ